MTSTQEKPTTVDVFMDNRGRRFIEIARQAEKERLYLNYTSALNLVMTNKDGRRYIEVAVHRATKQFFLMEFSKGEGDFVLARLNGCLGGVLRMMTEKQPYKQIKVRKTAPGAKLKLVLPQDFSHATIREEQLVALGLHLNSFFRQKFLSFVDGAQATGCSDHHAVVVFLGKYQIGENDWSLEAALEAWKRYKECRERIGELEDGV